jgi:hypothetical protein
MDTELEVICFDEYNSKENRDVSTTELTTAKAWPLLQHIEALETVISFRTPTECILPGKNTSVNQTMNIP